MDLQKKLCSRSFTCIAAMSKKIKQTPAVIDDKLIITCKNAEYYNLIQNIRNCKVLSKSEQFYVESLPKTNLIEIIKIYNDVVKLFNDS